MLRYFFEGVFKMENVSITQMLTSSNRLDMLEG